MPINNPMEDPTRLFFVDTEVFNGTSPNPAAWTDLDLSAVVGANHALVILRCYNADASARSFAVRPKGETECSFNTSDAFYKSSPSASSYCELITYTDAAGIIQWWYAQVDVAGITIDVVAYLV